MYLWNHFLPWLDFLFSSPKNSFIGTCTEFNVLTQCRRIKTGLPPAIISLRLFKHSHTQTSSFLHICAGNFAQYLCVRRISVYHTRVAVCMWCYHCECFVYTTRAATLVDYVQRVSILNFTTDSCSIATWRADGVLPSVHI